jgi:hypothetical protein
MMADLPRGGFCITTTQTFNHHQGIREATLNEIIRLLKTEVTKPNSEIARIDDKAVRSISIFAPPAK